MRFVLLLFVFLGTISLRAQRVMLFEKLTSSRSERVYEGELLRFRMKDDGFWQEGYIREMRPDIQALVINDRYILLEEIDAVHRGSTLANGVGYGLMTFGAGWSFFALVGYNIDNDDSTNYSASDALVTGISVGAGYLLVKLLGQRKFRTGKYKRLRIVDLNF